MKAAIRVRLTLLKGADATLATVFKILQWPCLARDAEVLVTPKTVLTELIYNVLSRLT